MCLWFSASKGIRIWSMLEEGSYAPLTPPLGIGHVHVYMSGMLCGSMAAYHTL